MNTQKSFPYRLLAPGPVPLPQSVREALQLPALHHRTPEFEALLETCFEGLKKIFSTQSPVLIQSATGSGVMESALVNTLSPGDEVLCVIGGKFGERWAEMAKAFGVQVHGLNLKWGDKLDLDLFESSLKRHPQVRAVLTQACETSTATIFPIQEMSRLTKQHTKALFMVDAITAMGCMDLPMDPWNLDVVVAGSQKAFMLPTGMGFIGISDLAKERYKSSQIKKFYFDWGPELKSHPKTTRFSTPNSMVVGLSKVIELFEQVGPEIVKQRCENLRDTTIWACEDLGLKLFSKSPSPSVTAIEMPDGIDGEKIRDWLEKEKNITVMGGQDQLKGKVLRIGHMGAITNEDMVAFFSHLSEGLKITPSKNFQSQLEALLKKSKEYFK